MKAMVLAAGEGRRLRPLTDSRPKALIEIEGVPMLEIVLRRLIAAGVDAAVVNVFHLAEQIIEFLETRDYGIRIAISRESELLDTGGGLKKVADFFDREPFFVHNVDVLSNLDLAALYRKHQGSGALATLAVRERPSTRCLLFDANDRLVGRSTPAGDEWARGPVPECRRLPFDGVQVLSPELLPQMTEAGAFSILKTYLRLAAEGADIRAYRSDAFYWQDIGTAQKLEEARRRARELGLV